MDGILASNGWYFSHKEYQKIDELYNQCIIGYHQKYIKC